MVNLIKGHFYLLHLNYGGKVLLQYSKKGHGCIDIGNLLFRRLADSPDFEFKYDNIFYSKNKFWKIYNKNQRNLTEVPAEDLPLYMSWKCFPMFRTQFLKK
jgi:hypothetical protein